MKALVLAGALLALAAFLPAPAAAQQTAALTIQLEPPQEALVEGSSLVVRGIVTFTADYTAVLGLTGIPVTYTVSAQPEWASVVVSPASDVFPLPSGPSSSPAYTVVKEVTVTITLASELAEDASAPVEITGTTTPTMLGKAATGKGSALIVYDAPEPPCPEHALTDEQLKLYAAQAADALAEYEAAREEPEGEVTTQSTGAATRAQLSWLAAGGFALLGAGVGLVLRRRLRP